MRTCHGRAIQCSFLGIWHPACRIRPVHVPHYPARAGDRRDAEGLTSIEAYKTTLSANVEGSRFHLDAVVKQISGTPAYEQIKHGRSEKERHGAIRRTASIEARVVFDALKALREVGASPSFPSRNFPAI